MTLIDKIVTWWHRRRFRKMATEAMGVLVPPGTASIHMKRFNPTKRRKPIVVSVMRDELVGATVLQSSEHAMRSVSSDSKTPGYAKHIEFNVYGETVRETYVKFKKL